MPTLKSKIFINVTSEHDFFPLQIFIRASNEKCNNFSKYCEYNIFSGDTCINEIPT